jgi:hypothetical protein
VSLLATCTYHCHFNCLVVLFVFVSHLYKPPSLNLSRGLGCFVSPLHLLLSLHLSSVWGVFVSSCTYRCHFICLVVWGVFVSHLYKPLSLKLSRGLGCFVSPLHLPLSLHLSSGLMCLCQSPIYTYHCHFISLVSGVSLLVPVHTAITLFVKWSEVSLSVTCIYHYYFISLVIWGVFVSLWYIPLSLYLSIGLRRLCQSLVLSLHLSSGSRCHCQSPVTADTSFV